MNKTSEKKILVTGVICPRCERKRAESRKGEDGRTVYRCVFCRHTWTPAAY